MKKALLFLAILITAGLGVFAQNISLSDGAHAVANGDTITVAGDLTSTLFCHINVTNNSAATMNIKCLRTNIDVIPGSTNQLCWGGQCWAVSVDLSPDPEIINAGATSTGFSGDYKANGNAGISIIRYRFFDMNNTSDSIMFHGKFDATLGLNEKNPITVTDIYPNPADNAAFFNYTMSSDINNAEIRVIDILGNKVQIIPVYEKEGKARINTEILNSGIYFYSMTVDGKAMFTKKLVVRHK